MALPPGVRRIFRLFVRSRDVGAEVDRELEFHLEETTDRLVAEGWDPAQARAEAERRFGRRGVVARAVFRIDTRREARGDRRLRLAGFRDDLRHAARRLRRAPGFTALAVATFGLGIGANVAVFTVLDGVVLRPLPYADPDRIVRIYERNARDGMELGNITIADFRDWRDQASLFASFAAFRFRSATIVTPDAAILLPAAQVTASFFDVLGVHPALGRGFRPDDEVSRAEPVVILSDGAWRTTLGADPAAVGRSIHLNGGSARVIGVLPRDFVAPTGSAIEVWMPNDFEGFAQDAARARRMHFLSGYARIRPGVRMERATEELIAVGRRLQTLHPRDNEGHLPNPVPVAEAAVRSIKPVLFFTSVGVAALLLLACANLANLVLARALSQGRELAVRAALGAGRGRLARTVLAEQGLLAGLGAVSGIGVAFWASRGLVALFGDVLPRSGRIGIDGRVLAFAVGLGVVAAVLTAVIPALLAVRLDLQSVLRADGRGTTAGRRSHRIRGGLVAVQVALAVMLATGAGLVARSLAALLDVDVGFEPKAVVTFGLPLQGDRYQTRAEIVRFADDLLDRIRRRPGVRSAGAAYAVPMQNTSTTGFHLEGTPLPSGPAPEAGYNAVSPGYFETLTIPVRAGRDFGPEDRLESPGVVIVNEAFVSRHLAGRPPLGQRLRAGPADDAPWVEIVGVVGNIRRQSVDEPPVPELYFPLSQDVSSSPSFVVAGPLPAVTMLEQVRRVVRELDPALPLAQPTSLEHVVDGVIARPRFLSILLGIFAGLALTLVGLGVNGVIAFVVAERTREIGVRRALGAGAGAVFRDVLRRGLGPVVGGLGVGLVGSLLLGPLARSLLYGVAPRDPVTLILVMVVILAAGLAGCLVPARRAVRVDPLTALRG